MVFEMMWRETVIAYFNVLIQHLRGRTEENYAKLQPRELPFGLRFERVCMIVRASTMNVSYMRAESLHLFFED
jgi:hypothetical protein